MGDAKECFVLQAEYDPRRACSPELKFLKERLEIVKIVAACGIVFSLAGYGVCAAFSRETNQRICFLNTSPSEVIHNIFYDKRNDAIITVSFGSDTLDCLHCRITSMTFIKRGQPHVGFPLFGSESFGFVDFDDYNGMAFTFSNRDSVYKIYDLENNVMLCSISDKNIQGYQICQELVYIAFLKDDGHLCLKTISTEDGTALKSFDHLLCPDKKVDFIKWFNKKLLVKQKNENLKIVDVHNSEFTEVNQTDFVTLSTFICLHKKQLFLTFENRTVSIRDIHWNLVTSYEDRLLWPPACNLISVNRTSDEDIIISYCKAAGTLSSEAKAGSIYINDIPTGKSLAIIKASSSSSGGKMRNPKQRSQASSVKSAVAKALEDITALFYDEEHDEIYTGNSSGLVHLWSK